MWKRNCWVKTLCVVLCLLLLVGCSRSAPLPAVTETVTVVDALGREVTVGKKPVRVAALIGSFAEVWQLAGGTVCAAPDDAPQSECAVAWNDTSIGVDWMLPQSDIVLSDKDKSNPPLSALEPLFSDND